MYLTNNSNAMSLEQAINEIYFFRGVVPLKAYEVLTHHQEEVTPYLIQILKNALLNHARTGDYYVAHIHALLLLSQFREKQAYPIVIELFNLPINSLDRLLGDLITETTPKIIASIFDGNPEPLYALLTNQKADNILRLVIASCFSALIYQKFIDKDMVILRIQEIVASGKMNEDRGFFTAIADLTMDCKLEPLYDIVRAAFRSNMILTDFMNIHFFEENLSKSIEQIMQEEGLLPLTDASQELTNWSSYTEENPIPVKIERNEPCPCGSGHKFKKCCISRL